MPDNKNKVTIEEKEGKFFINDIEATVTSKGFYKIIDNDITYYYNADGTLRRTQSKDLIVDTQNGEYIIGVPNPQGGHYSYKSKENPLLKDYTQNDLYKTTSEFNSFIDQDEELQDDIYNEFIKTYTEGYNKYSAKHKDLIPPKDLTKEQVIKILKKGNEDNSKIQSLLEDSDLIRSVNWDNWTNGRNYYYNKIANSLGVTPMNDAEIAIFQSAYQAIALISRDKKHADKFKKRNLEVTPIGVDDETWDDKGNISHFDLTYGNTSIGEVIRKAENEPVTDDPIVETEEPPPTNKKNPFTVDEVESGDDFAKEKPLLDTWFAPDIANFVGAITDPINRYEPVQGKVNLVTPGYDLLDPTRQLAANQEQMARYQYMLENSVDPQIALSASLAASGEGFQNAANVLANVENANVGIVNQAYQQNAAIENQEIAMNENARQKYIAEMATLNENMDKAKTLKKWRVINAYNQGWHNFSKDQLMEQVLFPQVRTDNIIGTAVRFSGNGRFIDEYNTYNNLYGMGNSQHSMPSTDALISYYDDLIEKGFTKEFAEKLLLDQVSTKKKNTRSFEQDYAEAQGLLTEQFGGVFNINDYIGI